MFSFLNPTADLLIVTTSTKWFFIFRFPNPKSPLSCKCTLISEAFCFRLLIRIPVSLLSQMPYKSRLSFPYELDLFISSHSHVLVEHFHLVYVDFIGVTFIGTKCYPNLPLEFNIKTWTLFAVKCSIVILVSTIIITIENRPLNLLACFI